MVGAFLLFSSLNLTNLTPKIDVANIVKSANANVPMDIAADPAFSQISLKFDSGQTIYIRIATDNDGSGKHNLNVHDNDYNLLSTYALNRLGNQFTVSFPAPQTSGTYSLEADIESGGSNLNLVKTITVGSGDNSSSNVKVENQVNSNSQSLGEASPSPVSLPTANPQAATKAQKINFFVSIWSGIFGFFRNLF